MIKYLNRGDFGSTDGNSPAAQVATDVVADQVGISPAAAEAGGGVCDSICGCANKDNAASANKKAELAKTYPTTDCGPNPTAACTAFNAQQIATQQSEYDKWKKAQDLNTGATMPPSDLEKIALVNALGKKMLALHPDTGNMTIAQIALKYPDDFHKLYDEVKAAYPTLKNLPPETALAMGPSVASRTLNDLISQTDTILEGGQSSANPASRKIASASSSSMGMIAGIGAAAIAALVLFTRKK